ncbi:hypothetical protein P1X14_06645 [Sphingomonas sp. AOB5]|uniref:hypothetical protein n=1 Tax=Sphingomonas sp. AOB5 TaxID=3034017 RepID=UPI0023F878F1|nr:hypothetical protein [Sphingomonas sp. AOB5]MDF7774916.1 hypothetical protein [Sphingomonas sp. AOB5]
MSVSEMILIGLAIAAPIIAATSAFWGLTREVSTKAEDGSKQLTPAGRVAIGFAAISALVAVTSIGFKAMVDNDKQRTEAERRERAAADARLLALQQKQAAEAEQRDEANWRAFNKRYQEALSQLGIAATREEGGRIVSNQDLLAAIEEQRDRTIAGNARIFQLAQSQRIVLQGQPLGSLRIRMTFGGFSATEFETLKEGFAAVAEYDESDDEYGRLADAHEYFDDSNSYRHTFIPLLQMLMADADSPEQTDDLILALDVDGTGAWVLPIGVTSQKATRGLVFNDDWLDAAGNPNGDPAEDIKQENGACTVPRMTMDQRRREVSLEVNLQGNCLPFAIHRAGTSNVIARLTDRPATVIYRNGNKLSPITATNVADITDWVTRNCWASQLYGKGGKYIQLTAVPNQRNDLAITRTLRFEGIGDMTYQPTFYDNREDWDAGRCARFR